MSVGGCVAVCGSVPRFVGGGATGVGDRASE